MIIFLYGQNDFLSKYKLKKLKNKFVSEVDPRGDSLTRLEGETINFAKISESLGTSSLFARKRMVVVENLFQNKKAEIFGELLAFLRKNSEGENIIIFWEQADNPGREGGAKKKELFKWLSEQTFSEKFEPLSAAKLEDWLRRETAARGGKIGPQAARHLAALTGGDLWQIDNEINKLLSFKKAKAGQLLGEEAPEITIAEIEDLVHSNLDENIFALTDAISSRQRSLAVKLLEDQLDSGQGEPYVLSMIIRQFRILLLIRESLDAGVSTRRIASDLKLHPFVVQKGLTQVRNFSAPLLRQAYSKLLELDLGSKTGRPGLAAALDQLIVSL